MSDQALGAVLAGIFGGAGTTLLWEMFFRPARERRNVAEVLAAEVSLNMQMLVGAQLVARADKVPTDFALSTTVFDSVTERVGSLPPDTVGEVVVLYQLVRKLNTLPQTYERCVDDIRRTEETAPHRQIMMGEVQQCINVFNSHVVKALARTQVVQPALLRVAFPRWSLRRWTRKPSVDLDPQDVASNIRKAMQERAALADRLANPGQGRSPDAA